MKYQNILLIDDDVEDQEIFTEALKEVSDRLKCTTMTNAKEALSQLDKKELHPDLIFLDLNMPIMTGIEFLKKIKSLDHLKSLPVIIFSTSSNPSTIAETTELGAIDFITKPSRFNDLVEILEPLFV